MDDSDDDIEKNDYDLCSKIFKSVAIIPFCVRPRIYTQHTCPSAVQPPPRVLATPNNAQYVGFGLQTNDHTPPAKMWY